MTQKDVDKLSRRRLLEMLAEITGKADRLELENERLKERIKDREAYLSQMGELISMITSPGGTAKASSDPLVEDFLRQVREIEKKNGLNDQQASSMTESQDSSADYPTREQFLIAANKQGSKSRYIWSLKTTLYALITVAAIAVLIAVLFLPVLQIYGSSMNPTLYEGDFVLSIKNSKMETGDLVAFYYNNKILVKRVIAKPGQYVDIDDDGNVSIDGSTLDEPYLTDKALGECNLDLPYQVPDGRVFVMGDNRSVSVDSRSKSIGCIAEEQIVGKIVYKLWPLSEFGTL